MAREPRFAQLLLVARGAGMTEALRRLTKPLPRSAQLKLREWRIQSRVRAGDLKSVAADLKVFHADEELKDHYRDAISLLEEHGRGEIGDYLEFGVYLGTSMSCMHEVLVERGRADVRLFGFDSFEGLPDTREDATAGHIDWKAGDYDMPIEATRQHLLDEGVDLERVTLVKGWFDETLAKDAVDDYGIEKAGVIMIDCDLQQPARDALEFCAPVIRDRAVVFFDDWWPETLGVKNVGEQAAFAEFLAAHPEFAVRELESYAPEYAKVFLVTRDGHG